MFSTPLVSVHHLFFKREDFNPTGSAKDRPLFILVKSAVKQGFKAAAISSTGNAAISALHFCRRHQLKLTIFLSPKIDPKKLSFIQSQQANIVLTHQPISRCFKFCRQNHAFNLRISQHPQAIAAYQQISRELTKQLPQLTSIFIPVGSGATLLGISQALPAGIPVFAVQPASHCPIASIFDSDFKPESATITTSLGAKSLPLKNQVITAIRQSKGSGLVVANQAALRQQRFLCQHQINTSAEGALALAGLKKAQQKNLNLGSYPVVILTGAPR